MDTSYYYLNNAFTPGTQTSYCPCCSVDASTKSQTTVLAKADFRVRSCPYLNVVETLVTRVLSHAVRNIDWDPTALVTSPRPSDLFNCAFCLL